MLVGSTAALVAILASDHSLAAALISGALVAISALVALMRYQESGLPDHERRLNWLEPRPWPRRGSISLRSISRQAGSEAIGRASRD